MALNQFGMAMIDIIRFETGIFAIAIYSEKAYYFDQFHDFFNRGGTIKTVLRDR